jgi:3-hydroxyisobutyrate dehydrogenase-like beta-hydroxyacid dehydrogenase
LSVQTVGVIGLGLLGGALAERFLRAGMRVIGFDPQPECMRSFAGAGGEPARDAAGVAAETEVIVLSLPDSSVVDSVVREVGSGLRGKLVIDTTTGDPESTEELGGRLAQIGVRYLDATIAGSSRQVRDGDVVVMAGGDADVYRASESLFRHFARHWYHVGPCGSGARMKLVVNLVLGLNRAVLAEALSFARRIGFDLSIVLDVLKSGPAFSRVMDTKGPKMIAGDFTPEARLSQHLKDVRLIREQGQRSGALLPLTTVHEMLLVRAEGLGLGHADNCGVIKAFDPPGGAPA